MIERICSRCSSRPSRLPLPKSPKRQPNSCSIRLAAPLKALASVVCLLASAHNLPSQEIEYRTLPTLLEQGTQSLARRDFLSAANSFNAIVTNYHEEAVWSDTSLPAKVLPLAGYASHKANLHGAAITALSEYLDTQNPDTDSRLFAQYTLATSLLSNGQIESAQNAFRELREQSGASPFRDLSLILQAQNSVRDAAITLLQELLSDPASQRLASYAQLELARLSMEGGNYEAATALILDDKYSLNNYSELATRSSLASQLAERVDLNDPALALRCYQTVAPKPGLIAAQKAELQKLKQTYYDLAPQLRTEQSMWSDYYRNSIANLESQIKSLYESEDYTDAIALRKARCFARLQRPLETWILLEELATNKGPMARIAHLDWISVARSMHAWQASAIIAQNFIIAYPEDEHVPQTLFMIALAQIEQKQFADAIHSLQTIANSQPNQELLASCHYYIGYCNYLISQYEQAIQSFRKAATVNSQSLLAGQAILWVGITHFTIFQIDDATQAFDSVLQKESWRALHPEASFRKAATLYAAGDLAGTEDILSKWMHNYSPHEREAEAYLLLGDALSESGKTSQALDAYKKVDSTNLNIAHSASAKQARIHLSNGDPTAGLNCLLQFERIHSISNSFAAEHFLLKSEVLSASSQPGLAIQELENAISSFGPNIEAHSMLEVILARYQHAFSEIKTLAARYPSDIEPTLLARYRVAWAKLARSSGSTTESKLITLSLVSDFSINQLPPEALLEAGNALLLIESQEAPFYFDAILDWFPNSVYTDDAHLGLAQHFKTIGDFGKGLQHAEAIEFPSPDSHVLQLELLDSLQRHSDAKNTAEAILAERRYPPHAKAKALIYLGTHFLENKNPEQAYAYFQRVFTLYRAEREEVATAYFACSKILNSQSRYSESRSVLNEFVSQSDLSHYPEYTKAHEMLETLPNLPQEVAQ